MDTAGKNDQKSSYTYRLFTDDIVSSQLISFAGIASYYTEYLPTLTWEGDNYMLTQQVARYVSALPLRRRAQSYAQD
jgi:hypothetical protein